MIWITVTVPLRFNSHANFRSATKQGATLLSTRQPPELYLGEGKPSLSLEKKKNKCSFSSTFVQHRVEPEGHLAFACGTLKSLARVHSRPGTHEQVFPDGNSCNGFLTDETLKEATAMTSFQRSHGCSLRPCNSPPGTP